MLIEVADPADNRRGQVIRTSFSAQRPTVTQSIDVVKYHGTSTVSWPGGEIFATIMFSARIAKQV
jgi:hypothetical protein